MFTNLLRRLKLIAVPSVQGTVNSFQKAIDKLEKVALHHDATNLEQKAKAEAALLKAEASALEANYARKVREKLNGLFGRDPVSKDTPAQ